MPDRYYAAACQIDSPNPKTRDEIPRRVKRMLEMIDFAVTGYEPFHDVKLVVFPEFAHAAPIYTNVDKLIKHLAIEVPNEFTDQYHKKAKALGIYIQTGSFLEVDPKWPGHVFNTTCLIGPDGIVSKYRKTHPWIPWEVHTSPHDLAGYDEPMYPVAETEIGRIGAAICYDWLFPECIRQLALNGAEILVRVSAYMDPWGTAAPLDWWTTVNRVRALENLAYVVSANQACSLSNYAPFSWPGGSMVVDYDGRVMAQTNPGPGEQIIVGPIDLAALRHERERRRGHNMLAHLRNESYTGYQTGIFPQHTANDQTISIESNNANIEEARKNRTSS